MQGAAALSGAIKVDIPLTSTQRLFLWAILDEESPYEIIGFGGARGGNKTAASCMAMVARRMLYPGTFGLMVRKTERAAVANLRDEIKKWAEFFQCRVDYNRTDKIFTFPDYDMGEIHLGFCRNERDYENYVGLQYADICFEEATQHSFMAWNLVAGSNRPNRLVRGRDVPPRMWATTNPGGVGHGWFKRVFVNDNTRRSNTLWIPSLLRDAWPTLVNDPGYMMRLTTGLPDWKRKQWVNGDWDALAGTYFDVPPWMIEKVVVPPYAEWFGGADWGFWPDPFACLWAATWKDDRGVNRLHVQSELKDYRLNPDQQARRALEKEIKLFDDGYAARPVKMRYADPHCWRRQEAESTEIGRTIAQMWAGNGWPCQKAATSARVPGWQQVRTLIANRRLTIDPKCEMFIEELTNAVHEGNEESPGEDIHSACENHLLDCLRYLVVSLFGTQIERPEEDPYSTLNKPGLQMQSRRRMGRRGRVRVLLARRNGGPGA